MLKIRLAVLLTSLTICSATFGQVAINSTGTSPEPSAMLDVSSSDKGLLIPRLTTAQRNTLASTAVAGLMVYDTDLDRFFFFNGSVWEEGTTGSLWSKSGLNTYVTNTGDNVGIGTITPGRKLEVYGGWKTARLSSYDAGAFLEFSGSNATNWAIGTYGGIARLLSSTDNFSNTNDQYLFSTTSFYPYNNSATTLGLITNRWSNLYSVAGNFSGAVATGSLTTTGNATISGNVGIGTTAPARTLDVNGPWKTARISSTSAGATLEFVSTTQNDWAISTWNGSMAFLQSTDDFATKTDEFYLTTSSFYPWVTNTKTLGTSTKRWSTLYSSVGNFNSSGSGIAGATVYAENTGTAGIGGYFESAGTDATVVMQQNGTGKFLKASGPNGGNEEIANDNNGTVNLYNSSYVRTIQIAPFEGGGTTGGQITMYNSAGAQTIAIDGDYTGDGRITTNELQITGGSDLSELFDLTDYDHIQKGMVVIIDENKPGSLKVSQTSYDRKVAGIVSGSNNIKPGLIMSQKGTIADGEHLIALSGRVYCMVDATNSPVKAGDMLTTSNVAGHAMKVENFDKARGAIIGKAMTSLDSGKGLVLVLVSLQ